MQFQETVTRIQEQMTRGAAKAAEAARSEHRRMVDEYRSRLRRSKLLPAVALLLGAVTLIIALKRH